MRAYFDFLASEHASWVGSTEGVETLPQTRNTPEILAVFEEVRAVFADVDGSRPRPDVDLDFLAAGCIAIAREIGDRMMARGRWMSPWPWTSSWRSSSAA